MNLPDDLKKEILAQAYSNCREKDLDLLLDEVQYELKKRNIKPTIELIEEVLDQ